jgi:hypothetical protein
MKHVFVVALFITIPALAGPVLAPCAVDTAANYVAQGSCSENPFVLKNFAWNGGFGSVPVSANNVDLVPATGSGQFGLGFQGAVGVPNPFNIGDGQTISAELDYTIDPRPPILNGFTLSLNPGSGTDAAPFAGPLGFSGVAGFATLTAFVCVGDTLADSCKNGVNLPKIVVDTRTALVANVDFTPTNIVDIHMILDMTGPISIVGGGTTVQSTTPEPGSLALALSGGGALLFLAYRRRQARSKQAP